MKLRTALNALKGRTVKVGSGVGFLYCDTVTDETLDTLDMMAHASRIKREYDLDFRKKRLDNFEKYWKDVRESELNKLREARRRDQEWVKARNDSLRAANSKERVKPTVTKTIKEYSKELTQRKLREKEFLTKFIAYETEYLDNWKRYSERDVVVRDGVDAIYASQDEDAVIVIFEGDESGKYWTSEEYRADVAKKKERKAA